MKEQGIDVPVLLEFFNRPSTFQKVFEQVKIARPSVLLLYQDGPREGRDDEENIKKCRRIAEDIDWQCTVYKKYQDINVGCDPSGFIAQSWAFTLVDKCIILEDDCVPCQSFFVFCKEMLERYENDNRINIICGMNNTEVTKRISADYLFTIKGSIWGWATWRRVAQTWDPEYKWLDNKETLKSMKEFYHNDKEFDEIVERALQRRATGKAYFEYIVGPAAWRGRRLNIVPKYNLISNIGPDEGGTHCGAGIENMPRYVRKLFYMKTYDYTLPIKAPNIIMRDYKFEREMTPSKFRMRIESISPTYKIFKLKLKKALTKLKNREISFIDCFRFVLQKIKPVTVLLYGIVNLVLSPSLIFKVNRFNGNRVKCAGSRVSRLKLKIAGKNNRIVCGFMSELKGCRISILGNNNVITIGRNSHLLEGARDKLGCYISIGGSDNRISIGDNCYLIDVQLFEEDKNNCICVESNSGVYNNSELSAIEGTNLSIGKNSLISSNVHFRTGDSHTVLDSKRKRCNPSKDIVVGEHVWIGTRAMLLKGSEVKKNSIIAASSVLTKRFEEENVIIAGNPAKIVKRDTDWEGIRI